MQRIIEVLVGIPSLIIVILFLMAFPAGVGTIIAALSITGWVNMARLVRAEILKLKNQEFVLASQVLGTSKFNIIMKDLIPNTVSVIVINVMFTIPSAIFTEAFLSFIGIGLAEPQASLGVLINGGYQVLRMYPHVLIFPAIVIVLIMVCFSILGDGLRDALDPQMRSRYSYGKILEVKNLTVHIKTHKGVVQAVRGVDFYLNEQETLAVVGESGSGKSITMKGVMGILPKNGKVVEGSVMFQGNDLTKYSERQMQQVRGSEIAMIFQDPMTSLNPVTR